MTVRELIRVLGALEKTAWDWDVGIPDGDELMGLRIRRHEKECAFCFEPCGWNDPDNRATSRTIKKALSHVKVARSLHSSSTRMKKSP